MTIIVNSFQKKVQGQALQIIYRQFAGVVILSLCTLLLFNAHAAFSVFAGGLAYTLPNFLFVLRVFRYGGAQQMNQFMAAFFLGEMIKLFLSGFLFLLVVKYLPVSLLSVLVGFAGAIVFFWIACLWRYSGQAKSNNF